MSEAGDNSVKRHLAKKEDISPSRSEKQKAIETLPIEEYLSSVDDGDDDFEDSLHAPLHMVSVDRYLSLLVEQEFDIPSPVMVPSNVDEDRHEYMSLSVKLFGITEEQAGRDYDELARRHFNAAALNPLDRYATKDAREDAISFYERVWSHRVVSGETFLQDVDAADPGLIEAVRNRSQYLARKQGRAAAHMLPTGFPPIPRPDPEATQLRRTKNRLKEARRRERLSVPTDPRP